MQKGGSGERTHGDSRVNVSKKRIGNCSCACTKIDQKYSIDHANSSRQIACCYLYFQGLKSVGPIITHSSDFSSPIIQ